MTREEALAKWRAVLDAGERYGAMVHISKIVPEFLTDIQALAAAGTDVLSITEAALLSGYSQDHLRKEIAKGTIPNAGRKGKPALRRADVPQKPGHTPPLPNASTATDSSRRRIALEANHTPPRSA